MMMGNSPAEVTASVEGECRVIRVSGGLDYDSASLLGAALTESLQGDTARTVIDLSATDFADSTFLHVLLSAHRKHQRAQRELVMAGPFHAVVDRLFEITGTAGHFTFVDSVSRALRA
ncbi:STAS domain-containing protein [Streptomyces sp. NPDC048650]|uniref:STAS domain-containing protein n=1 Tax=unclassified Streptomyces TaxID=2593676 RepID=UPI003721AE65